MCLCYIVWLFIETTLYIYFFPEAKEYLLKVNLLKLIPGIGLCSLLLLIITSIEKRIFSKRNHLIITSFITVVFITVIYAFITAFIRGYVKKSGAILNLELTLTPFFNWFFFFLGSGFSYLFISYHRKSGEQEKQLKLTRALADEARLMMLRYQINPHFLFNALNTIQSVIKTDQNRAISMIGELAEFFRYTLTKNEQVFVNLETEINAVKNYLSIQKERFGETLNLSYEIDSNTLNAKIPFFIIHPLVENAIKYGLSPGNNMLHLIIQSRRNGDNITIIVRNSGTMRNNISSDLSDPFSTKTGIENLKKRLTLLYPDSFEFLLFEEDGYVNAVLTIGTIKNQKD